MKKYLLVFIALLFTGAVVMATVLNSNKKTTVRKEKRSAPTKKHNVRGRQRLPAIKRKSPAESGAFSFAVKAIFFTRP